jgi:hypothetical protein
VRQQVRTGIRKQSELRLCVGWLEKSLPVCTSKSVGTFHEIGIRSDQFMDLLVELAD